MTNENHYIDYEKFGKTLYNHIKKIWIDPEIERRSKNGKDFTDQIKAVQILIYPEKETIIRFNDEVEAYVTCYKKKGVTKEKGDLVYDYEVEGIKSVKITRIDDPNCAQILILRLQNYYHIYFDFRYNKPIALNFISSSKEFYKSASNNYEKNVIPPFVDNLYSSAELAIKSLFLTWPNIKPHKRLSHKIIKKMYEEYAELGNVKEECKNVFNELYELRPRVRYFQPEYDISKAKMEYYLKIVKELIEDMEKRIT